MTFNNSTVINGFVLMLDGRVIGPFDTPDEAAKWVMTKMGPQYLWHIEALFDPKAREN